MARRADRLIRWQAAGATEVLPNAAFGPGWAWSGDESLVEIYGPRGNVRHVVHVTDEEDAILTVTELAPTIAFIRER